MRINRIIYTCILAAASLLFTCCEETIDKQKQKVQFTVRYSDSSYDYAIINVKHDGPDDITWYGFLTEDVTTAELLLINKEMGNLLKTGEAIPVRKETDRNILLEDLKENTEYKYIAFGITEEGKLYENVGYGSTEFSTTKNIYVLTETPEDWTVTRLENRSTEGKELIEVKANKGGRFAWNYLSKESVEQWQKAYPEGYELWVDDIYMTTVDVFQLFALEQISLIQYDMSLGSKITDLTYVYEEGKPFELDRLNSGDYYVVVYGFQGDGQHTQKYSVTEINIPEEKAEDGYTRWFGTYSFTGEAEVTDDDGETVREKRSYNILIEHYDNNFMYRVHGWECGDDVNYDWEEDIMQIDKSKDQFLAFPAYYNDGSLEIRESPMTYITFDGINELILGIYGYAYNQQEKGEIPVILDGTPMASAAPIADGQTTTTLNGLEAEYSYTDEYGRDQVIDLKYCKMGYIAWSEQNWQTINPPLRFPITITKTEAESDAQVQIISATQSRSMFSAKKISTDAVTKNFDRLKDRRPEVFNRAQ